MKDASVSTAVLSLKYCMSVLVCWPLWYSPLVANVELRLKGVRIPAQYKAMKPCSYVKNSPPKKKSEGGQNSSAMENAALR